MVMSPRCKRPNLTANHMVIKPQTLRVYAGGTKLRSQRVKSSAGVRSLLATALRCVARTQSFTVAAGSKYSSGKRLQAPKRRLNSTYFPLNPEFNSPQRTFLPQTFTRSLSARGTTFGAASWVASAGRARSDEMRSCAYCSFSCCSVVGPSS